MIKVAHLTVASTPVKLSFEDQDGITSGANSFIPNYGHTIEVNPSAPIVIGNENVALSGENQGYAIDSPRIFEITKGNDLYAIAASGSVTVSVLGVNV